MVGEGHGGVADAGREHLDQRGGLRTVERGRGDDEHEQDHDQQGHVRMRAVGLLGIAGRLQLGGDGVAVFALSAFRSARPGLRRR